MRHPRRLASPAAVVATLFALAALLPLGAGPVLAKDGFLAAFDAPIAFDTPPGTEILVGVTVTSLADDGELPPDDSPIVLILTGRDGSTTEAYGVEDAPGHHVMRIVVPPGGPRDARVVMRGMNDDGPADIEAWLTNDPFTFGGVTPRTAQVAPAPAPVVTLPRASAVTQGPQASAAPATASGPADATADGATWWIPALGLVVLGVAVVLAVRLRFGRRPAQGT